MLPDRNYRRLLPAGATDRSMERQRGMLGIPSPVPVHIGRIESYYLGRLNYISGWTANG
jgi:hypothetical protein